jgi:hypothetical protein
MVVINQAFFADASLDAQLIDHYAAANKQEIAQWQKGAQLSTRWGLEFGQGHEGECPGDIRLKRINQLLDTILYGLGDEWQEGRSESQILFHDSYILAALPKIYGSRDWERHSARLLAKYGVKEAKSLVLGLTPRRWGKTVAVASFCAVMLLCVAALTISTFSTGRRASSLLMELMQRMISSVEGAESRMVKANAEALSIAQTSLSAGQGQSSMSARRKANASDTSTFRSYPSNVDGQ